jgi:hypothetical protein
VLWFMVLLGVAIFSIVLVWLWLFCERHWVGTFGICFDAALIVAGFVFGGWWWLAAIVAIMLVAATLFHHARAPVPAEQTSDDGAE